MLTFVRSRWRQFRRRDKVCMVIGLIGCTLVIVNTMAMHYGWF